MKTLLSCILVMVLLSGCATSTLRSEKILPDGTKINYVAKIGTMFQDFSGSDLSATLNPDGKNTIKAGAVDNTTSQVAADVAASMVALVEAMLPFITTLPATP